jgi:DNA-directed RNA polymerase subunit RPC12/RpoP
MVAAGSAAARGFNCSNCGAPVELRALQHARAVACTSCGSILDPRDPNLRVLQKARSKESITPDIPLGTRGTWHGQPWEVIGFQRRSIEVDGIRYSWDEYVLFNPYRGFRYLSRYEGHWNDIRTVRELPEPIGAGKRPTIRYQGETYAHFQSATARTDFVLGEFPWRVRLGDEVKVSDYNAPPYLLSSETTDDETTWSLGRYTDAQRIWQAFSVPGSPRTPSGVFANQPNPYKERASRSYRTLGLLLALFLVLVVGRLVTAAREQLLAARYTYQPKDQNAAFVTEPFAVRAPGTVEITLSADLTNAWIDFDLALINTDSGVAWNVERELSYYSGTDSDGAWSEGSRERRVLLPRIPAGEYYLRVEPEGEATSQPVSYVIQVRRDVPSLLPYGVALLLLVAPSIAATARSSSFERRRMQESDYGD